MRSGMATVLGGENVDELATNLDAMPLDELEAWWPDERKLTAREVEQLRRYRNKKVLAMRARLAGLIDQAMLWESHCEDEYACMSDRIRW